MAEVMGTVGKSTAATASLSSGRSMDTAGCACRLEPMRLAARSTSSAPVTARRTSRPLAHLAARDSSSQPAGTAGKVESWPERITAVTAAEVNAALEQVLREEQSVTSYLLPDETS